MKKNSDKMSKYTRDDKIYFNYINKIQQLRFVRQPTAYVVKKK